MGIKVTFLGTNGWYDTGTGNTICVLIETPREYVVLDAGNGIYKLDRHIKSLKPIYLFLSHFHLDHIIGLHVLAKFKFKQGLHICFHKGRHKVFNSIMSRKFTAPLNRLSYQTEVIELSGGKNKITFLDKFLRLKHPIPCFGFRFKFKGKIISYLADTGTCQNAFALAKGADLVISECAYKEGIECAQWPHLNPRAAAQIAKESGAKKLALVHFDAGIYTTLRQRKQAAQLARKIFKNTVAAHDEMILKMGGK